MAVFDIVLTFLTSLFEVNRKVELLMINLFLLSDSDDIKDIADDKTV